jgi:hypothetical protein
MRVGSLLGIGTILLATALIGWSIQSILYSINYYSPWEIANQQHLNVDQLIVTSLILCTNIISLAVSINILAIGVRLQRGKPAGRMQYTLAYLIGVLAITSGSEFIVYGITTRELPIISGFILIASTLMLRRKTARWNARAGILIVFALALYYIANPWEPMVSRLALLGIYNDNAVLMQILSLHIPTYAFGYLLGASQVMFTSIGLGVITRLVLSSVLFDTRMKMALRLSWLLAIVLFGVSFVVVGLVSCYSLFELLRAELGATLDPLILQTLNIGLLELETTLGIVVFAIGGLAGVIISLYGVSELREWLMGNQSRVEPLIGSQ